MTVPPARLSRRSLQGERLELHYIDLDDARRWDRNPKLHDLGAIAASIRRHGFKDPPKYEPTLDAFAEGNGRTEVLTKMREGREENPRGILLHGKEGRWAMPVLFGIDAASRAEAEAYAIDHNNLVVAGGAGGLDDLMRLYDRELLLEVLTSAAAEGVGSETIDLDDLDALLAAAPPAPAESPLEPPPPDAVVLSLAERFGAPPFSVLDARQGYWTTRRDWWLSLGIRSGEGREKGLLSGGPQATISGYYYKLESGMSREEIESTAKMLRTTSEFDPVLAELAVRWYSPPGGVVLDPFAGGSVRGIVSAMTGRRYVGIELRPEQVAANVEQLATLSSRYAVAGSCTWTVGDARDAELEPADLVLACPPYYDLEQYSDDPRDLSAMSWEDFLEAYRAIIRRSVAALRPDRFVVWVINDVRDRRGLNRGLTRLTEQAFVEAGANAYNDAVLIRQLSTAPIRAIEPFQTSRKLCRTHENVLVFIKGDPRRATAACGPVEVALEAPDEEEEPS